MDPETYFDELPDPASALIRGFIEDVPLLGAELQWRHYGPRVRVSGAAGPKVVVSVERDNAVLTLGTLQGIDPQPASRALARLQRVAGFDVKPTATYPSLNIKKASREELEAFFDIARDYVRELLESRQT